MAPLRSLVLLRTYGSHAPDHRRLLALVLLALLPWTVVYVDGTASAVFSFGLVNLPSFHVVDVYHYLFVHTRGLPPRLQSWPAGILLHASALASAGLGLRDREDPRLTGGLLVFAGFAHAHVAFGLARLYGFGLSPLVLPIGAVASWAVVWWFYWPLVRDRRRSNSA